MKWLLILAVLGSHHFNANDVDYIEIHNAGLTIESEAHIYCNDLYTDLGFLMDTTVIHDRKAINYFMSALDSMVKDTSEHYYKTIDARGKVYIKYKNGKQDVLCISSYEVFMYNGEYCRLPSRTLIDYIDDFKYKKPKKKK